MIPLNSYFRKFEDEFALRSENDGVDLSELLKLVNLEMNIEKLKSNYKRAYRLAHESVAKIGFVFFHDRDVPTYSYLPVYNQIDNNWNGFVIVKDDIPSCMMESITMQAISDCHLKMLRQRRR